MDRVWERETRGETDISKEREREQKWREDEKRKKERVRHSDPAGF